jgi:hypothetical protein
VAYIQTVALCRDTYTRSKTSQGPVLQVTYFELKLPCLVVVFAGALALMRMGFEFALDPRPMVMISYIICRAVTHILHLQLRCKPWPKMGFKAAAPTCLD